MELSGQFRSTNEMCPIADYSLALEDRVWAEMEENGADGFIIRRKDTDPDNVSYEDERFFTMTATAQGGATVTAEYKMKIVDKPDLTTAGIACIVLGILLCLSLASFAGLSCCGGT